jgi:hypothetical protein
VAGGDGVAPLGALLLPNAYLYAQLSLRKKNQSSSPGRAATIRTAIKKKRTITILLGYGSKTEAR